MNHKKLSILATALLPIIWCLSIIFIPPASKASVPHPDFTDQSFYTYIINALNDDSIGGIGDR